MCRLEKPSRDQKIQPYPERNDSFEQNEGCLRIFSDCILGVLSFSVQCALSLCGRVRLVADRGVSEGSREQELFVQKRLLHLNH